MSDALADLLAQAHYTLVAPILDEHEYAAMAQYLRDRGVVAPATKEQRRWALLEALSALDADDAAQTTTND